jgi:phage baseplate assembly protein gpV
MRTLFVTFLLVLVGIIALPAFALQHATEGVITRVDSAAKQVAVKTADGTEEVFHFTEKTALHAAKGAKTGAVDTYLAGKEGTHVVVRYTGEGADKAATGIDDFGKDTVKVSKGTITKFDKASHTITVKAEDGSEQTYHVAKDATIDTAHGVIKRSEYAAKKGENASVHYSEEAGHKVVHFIKHL